ncbi:hypothetical protein VR010_14230 [Actinomycetaceae bacterium L2_0104]
MQIVSGLGVFWRSREVLQIGLDSRVGVLVEGLSPQEQELVAFLTSPRTAAELNPMAEARGIDTARLTDILTMLHRAGVLEGLPLNSASEDTHTKAVIASSASRRLPASAALSNSLRPVRSSVPRADRGERHVSISHLNPLGTEIGIKLAEHGVGTVSFSDRRRVNAHDHPLLWPRWQGLPREQAMTTVLRQFSPDTLLQGDGEPDVAVYSGSRLVNPVATQEYMDSGTPHLLAWTEEVDVCIGPLVEPQLSPCAGCLHESRLAADPAWSVLMPQAENTHPLIAAGETRDLAAAIAVRSILGFLDGVGNSLRDAQWRVPPLPNFPRFVAISSHPTCGCTSHQAMIRALESTTTGQAT